MEILKVGIPGVLIIKPQVFSDKRGFFKESFQLDRYRALGIELEFVQDNFSRSDKNTLRGLHFQKKRPQGKLVSCVRGSIYDVVVDVSPSSSTFGQYFGLELSSSNHTQLWIPPGYAHGFIVLSDIADVHYKCTEFYNSADEGGLIWNDSTVGINWPIDQPKLSEKDMRLPNLTEILEDQSLQCVY